MARKKDEKSFDDLNDWGIPNWQCKRAYSDAASWHDDRWRWEFYRRREDLRDFFDEWANESRHLPCNQGLSPNDRGFLAYTNDTHRGEGIDRFGYIGIPNPRIGDQPAAMIRPDSSFMDMFRVKRGTDPRASRGVLEVTEMQKRREYSVHLAKHELAIRFDLDKPLTPQLKHAHARLRKDQKELHSKLLAPRKNEPKWSDYLRALDARASGATWSEITSVFFEDGTIKGAPSPEGGIECPSPSTGRWRYLKAKKLQYNF